MEPILRVEGVTKTFTSGPKRLDVLTGVDLAVGRGEIVAIVGPSGVGKSTLLHIMGTLDTPTAGRVVIDSTDAFALSDAVAVPLRSILRGWGYSPPVL